MLDGNWETIKHVCQQIYREINLCMHIYIVTVALCVCVYPAVAVCMSILVLVLVCVCVCQPGEQRNNQV